LKKKYNVNSVRVRTGDSVTVLRGQFKGKSGAVDRVDVSREKVYVVGVETIKKDGAKSLYPIHASNVMVTAVKSEDKKRFKSSSAKKETKESN
jgi:large subunit ribosomal protein L24